MSKDTIFALSTSPGKSGIAIIRVSGPSSFSVVENLTGSCPPLRKATLRYLKYNSEVLDRALVICFAAGASFTGENMAEFHIHGSFAVIKGVTEVLSEGLQLRCAEPGEFTRRALENGRLDLVQAEGLAELINSETKEQKKQSIKIIAGALSNKTNEWREKLLAALSLLEVMIDFSDEDVPTNTTSEVRGILDFLITDLLAELNNYKTAEIVRDGYDVAILGKPNVGKSSLLNFIAGSEKAIVTDQAGTTRDIIEVKIDIDGYAVNFYDTAGIQETDDAVEKIGIERAIKRSKTVDLRIFLVEPDELLEKFQDFMKKGDLVFCAKGDIQEFPPYPGISSKTGEGTEILLKKIKRNISKAGCYSSILLNERHKRAIIETLSYLKCVQKELENKVVRVEIAAEEVRAAIAEIDVLVGKINVEDILGRVFSTFCIGK